MQTVLSHRIFSTRGGTIAVGLFAAGFAALLLLTYLNRYRSSLNAAANPVTVLVAKNLIPKGTSGTLIASKNLFQVASVREAQLKEGAIADPAVIKGRVAIDDIYPGQQFTAADFTASTSDAVATKITGYHRGISVAIDPAHGMIGHIEAGDHVDVYAGMKVEGTYCWRPRRCFSTHGEEKAVLKLVGSNVLVLSVPEEASSGPGSSGGTNVVLRVKPAQAENVAFASDNGRLWLVLRPTSGAKPAKPRLVTVESLLFGQRPLVVTGYEKGKP